MDNIGRTAAEVARVKQEMLEAGTPFLLTDEPQLPEFKHFYFVGNHEGKEVVFDAVVYTLEMYYASTLYEIAEEEAVKQFPHYKPYDLNVDESGEIIADGEVDEEIEEYKASIIMELQEDDEVKVKETIQFDADFDYGVGLEAMLNVEEVTEEVITKFISEFNAGTLRLDENLYSFELPDADEEDED